MKTGMDREISEQFERQNEKLEAIQRSVDRIRKQLLWKSIVNAILFILPLIGIAISIPWLINIIAPIERLR